MNNCNSIFSIKMANMLSATSLVEAFLSRSNFWTESQFLFQGDANAFTYYTKTPTESFVWSL